MWPEYQEINEFIMLINMKGQILLDIQTLLFVSSIVIGIISFFIVRTYKVIDKLSDSINQLNGLILVIQERDNNRDLVCKSNHEVVTVRLNKHSEIIGEHSKDIAEIKAKL